LSEILTSRGHSCLIVDSSEYIPFNSKNDSNFEKIAYLKELSKSSSTLLDVSFKSKGVLGSAFFIAQFLKQSKPDCVVVGLDADSEHRLVVNVCKKLKIPVVLIQDGSWDSLYSAPSITQLLIACLKNLMRGRFLKFTSNIDLLIASFLFGNLQFCNYGCSGADKIGIFSEVVRRQLLELQVPSNSIVITGNIICYLDRKSLEKRKEKEQKENSSLNKKNENKRLVVISSLLCVYSKELEYKILSSIFLAFKEVEFLGWELFIRLHPREKKSSWESVINELQLSIQPVISNDVIWRDKDIVLGFNSTLLLNVSLDQIPLIIYDLQYKNANQSSFFDIASMGICNDHSSLVNILANYNLPNEAKLNQACEKAKNTLGFNDNVVENVLNLIEST